MTANGNTSFWWERADLSYKNKILFLADQSILDLFERYPTPLFVYNPERVLAKIRMLQEALDRNGFSGKNRIYFAMKANRHAPLLAFLSRTGVCGIDACSPREVSHALSCGFSAQDISYTGTSLSQEDIEKLSVFSGMHINIDSRFTLKSWAESGGSRKIGIRINPAAGTGRGGNDKLHYSGADTTKFGIYREQFEDALREARDLGLTVSRIHFHTGCGYLNEQLPLLDRVLSAAGWFLDRLPDLEAVNTGGGLGVRHLAADEELDLDAWASMLAGHLAGRNVRLEVEPGDFLVKDAGLLLARVNYQEFKKDTLFTFLDCGFNIAPEPAQYSLPFEPVSVYRRSGATQESTFAGNINEALDIWYRRIDLPPLEPGDPVALINAGSYSASMASNHCMRGDFHELMLDPSP